MLSISSVGVSMIITSLTTLICFVTVPQLFVAVITIALFPAFRLTLLVYVIDAEL